ncbi:MAG: hypothetical protein ACPGEC_00185 [Flavobacteriales bacterium]
MNLVLMWTFNKHLFSCFLALLCLYSRLLRIVSLVAPSYPFGFKISAEKQWSKLRLNTFIRTENLLNHNYRDYLNRQRYFADDLGFNLIVGTSIVF